MCEGGSVCAYGKVVRGSVPVCIRGRGGVSASPCECACPCEAYEKAPFCVCLYGCLHVSVCLGVGESM